MRTGSGFRTIRLRCGAVFKIGGPSTSSTHLEHGLSSLPDHKPRSQKTLREAGLVNSPPEGTRCYVSLRPDFEQRFPELLKAVLRLTRER